MVTLTLTRQLRQLNTARATRATSATRRHRSASLDGHRIGGETLDITLGLRLWLCLGLLLLGLCLAALLGCLPQRQAQIRCGQAYIDRPVLLTARPLA